MKGSTHKEGHTIDLIISRCSEIVLAAPPKVDRFISDHASVCCRLIPEKPPAVEKLVTYRKYRSIDMESFKNDLERWPFGHLDGHSCLLSYGQTPTLNLVEADVNE